MRRKSIVGAPLLLGGGDCTLDSACTCGKVARIHFTIADAGAVGGMGGQGVADECDAADSWGVISRVASCRGAGVPIINGDGYVSDGVAHVVSVCGAITDNSDFGCCSTYCYLVWFWDTVDLDYCNLVLLFSYQYCTYARVAKHTSRVSAAISCVACTAVGYVVVLSPTIVIAVIFCGTTDCSGIRADFCNHWRMGGEQSGIGGLHFAL